MHSTYVFYFSKCLLFDFSGHSIEERSIRKSAALGGSKIMECNINYPGGEFVQHIIQWQKQGIEVPIFMKFNGYPPHIDPTFSNRVRLIEKATIEISEIRKSDEGWYECKIIFLDGMDESKVNGTWIYLSVNGKSYCLICPRKDCIVFEMYHVKSKVLFSYRSGMTNINFSLYNNTFHLWMLLIFGSF